MATYAQHLVNITEQEREAMVNRLEQIHEQLLTEADRYKEGTVEHELRRQLAALALNASTPWQFSSNIMSQPHTYHTAVHALGRNTYTVTRNLVETRHDATAVAPESITRLAIGYTAFGGPLEKRLCSRPEPRAVLQINTDSSVWGGLARLDSRADVLEPVTISPDIIAELAGRDGLLDRLTLNRTIPTASNSLA